MTQVKCNELEYDGSHLTIREDLVEDGLSVPVHFLDYKEDVHIEQTDTLNVECIFSTDGEELYEGMTPFESDSLFYNKFLIPIMNNAYNGMNDGGHMCINISPKMYKNLIKYGYRECDEKVDLRQQLGKQYKTKSQDFIYVWNK